MTSVTNKPNRSPMSKRPNSAQLTTAKRPRKSSGFRLARTGLTDPVQSMSGSSRFVTLNENPKGRSFLAQNRLLPRSSEPSQRQSEGAETQISEPTLGLQAAAPQEEGLQEAPQEELQTDTNPEQGKRKRKHHTKTSVSSYSTSNLCMSKLGSRINSTNGWNSDQVSWMKPCDMMASLTSLAKPTVQNAEKRMAL